MSSLMFNVSTGILLVTILVLVIVYWFQRPKPPGHVPTTLIEAYALLYASNAKEECGRGIPGKEGQNV